MSGGEQQMVAIGRAMMSAPEFMLLDEPSLGLSPLLAHELFESLVEVRKTGVGILLVEQNAKQSLRIADRGYLIETGHIVGHGIASDLVADPAVHEAYLGVGGLREPILIDGDAGDRPRANGRDRETEAAIDRASIRTMPSDLAGDAARAGSWSGGKSHVSHKARSSPTAKSPPAATARSTGSIR